MTEEIKEQKEDVLLDAEGNILDKGSTEKEEPPRGEGEDDAPAKADAETHDDDEREEEGESEEDAEARRERNRQRRKENKERRHEYIDSLKRELAARDELLQRQASRLDALERRTHGADMAAVDSELQKSADAYNYFKLQHAEAVTAANGALATDAQEKMMQAYQRHQQLTKIRQAAQRQVNAPQPQPLDPRLKMRAERWLEKNSWYDPDGKDSDSQITLTIDQQLHREGWNPTTEQYWEELDARVKKYLPHRYGSGYNKSQVNRAKAPVAGSGRESSNNSSGGYRLSSDRVQALKDAGMWDDPKSRADAIKRFQQYDKEQANG